MTPNSLTVYRRREGQGRSTKPLSFMSKVGRSPKLSTTNCEGGHSGCVTATDAAAKQFLLAACLRSGRNHRFPRANPTASSRSWPSLLGDPPPNPKPRFHSRA
jgi:hypothetical protein